MLKMELRLKLKKYRLSKLGEGSFTHVYQALNKKNENDVLVVKQLNLDFKDNEKVLDRFNQEFEILKKFENRDGFPIRISRGQLASLPYLAYEYIPGNSLINSLKSWSENRFQPIVCSNIILSLLNIISLLHLEKIVHSDISPENLILNKNKISLIDFGCAQILSGNSLANQWIGKPSYLSPEQARGENWDQRSDIYQIGIIFYEMLCGQKYNLGKSAKEKIAFASNPIAPSYEKIPLILRPLIESMLKVNPDERITTVDSYRKKINYSITVLRKNNL